MALEFCSCGSLKVEGLCTNHKGNCPEGAKRRVAVDFKKEGYIRHIKTGRLIDKQTGTVIEGR